jgi:GT2 family glycosyltransferase
MLACNHADKTLSAVKHLHESSFRDWDLFLVDNGSGKGIADRVESAYPGTIVERIDDNVGAGEGRNHILERFHSEQTYTHLLFLDNDVYLNAGAIDEALAAMADMRVQRVRVGGVGAHLFYAGEPEILWSAGGGILDWDQAAFTDSGQGRRQADLSDSPRRVDSIPTAFLLCSRDAVEAAGRFVPDYLIYLEDADWCHRMTRAGFELWTCPRATGAHDVSSSVGMCSPGFHYLRTRNRLWFFQANAPHGPRQVRGTIVRNALWHSAYPELRHGRVRAAWSVVRGLVAGMRVPDAVKNAGGAAE